MKKLSDKQILKLAVEKAQNNGWNCDVSKEQLCITRCSQIIFDLDFAKCYFGEAKLYRCPDCKKISKKGDKVTCNITKEDFIGIAYLYYLQQLVLEKDRIKYLGKFLDS